MTDGQPRTREQRRADTLAKLTAPAADVWVATQTLIAARLEKLGHREQLTVTWHRI